MTREHFFGKAKWVGQTERDHGAFSILRGSFYASSANKVMLNVLGLGFFKCFINGICINPDTFLPLSSDYDDSCDPEGEILSGHRIYVPGFDITPYTKEGKNTIAIHFGGGWYTWLRIFGLPKAIYRILVEEPCGIKEYVSDEDCRIGRGYVKDYLFVNLEHHDYSVPVSCLGNDFDDSDWDHAVEREDLNTEYCATDCPADTLIETLHAERVGEGKEGIIYDCGQNTTGYPVLNVFAKEGDAVRVLFSEDLTEDKILDMDHSHSQRFIAECDGNPMTVQPEFTWFGFRYFEVIGDAVPECVKVVHADVPVCSSFESDNETLNWIYKTFVHTMLTNMHTGIPSDCPHIERRGYTGDGQLTCHATLTVLDAERFYKKWIRDIADSQDTLTGHIQHTAPYVRSGGGPGGWGCAIIEVPYQFYKHFGDDDVLKEYYPYMLRYIDFMEEHSEYGLVTSDKEGDWCLGDWCCPNILYTDKDITYSDQQTIIPAPYVNTYFLVRSLTTLSEIADTIGNYSDAEELRKKADYHKGAIRAAYLHTFDGNFIMNIQGANAFALEIGLGDERTYSNTVNYYQKIGHYDTRIFATDILTKVLFEKGDAELAVRLLTSGGPQGYEHWKELGATTFHEYWDSERSRSHNHPMFGSPVAYFFEYLLGIKQKDGTSGYKNLVIEPKTVSLINRMSGSIRTKAGVISVSYEKDESQMHFSITVPKNTVAKLKYFSDEAQLHEGANTFCFKLT